MARIYFHPFNQEGEVVKRGVTSMSAKSTREAIAEKIASISRKPDLGKIVHVHVTDKDEFLISAWDVRADSVVQTDGEGSEHFNTARIPAKTWGESPANTENEMATNAPTGAAGAAKNPAVADGGAKADAAAKAKPAKAAAAPKAPKGPSKKDTVLAMLKDRAGFKDGVKLADIEKKLSISSAAARALIGDCQRVQGVTIKREKRENESFYTA